MTAFHNMILLSWGAPLIPAGGSCCKRLKSRISLFLDGVDMAGYVSNRRRLASSPPPVHRLLPLPVLYPQLLCSSFLAPCLCFLFLGYFSLSISFFSLLLLLHTQTPSPASPGRYLLWFSRGRTRRNGLWCSKQSEKSKNGNEVETLVGLESERASQRASQRERKTARTGVGPPRQPRGSFFRQQGPFYLVSLSPVT